MNPFFEVIDKTKRRIYLTRERLSHILEHKEIANYIEEIKDTLINPLKIYSYSYDKTVAYYYKYLKNKKSDAKYLLVAVKYLNGNGFVITSYFIRNIK